MGRKLTLIAFAMASLMALTACGGDSKPSSNGGGANGGAGGTDPDPAPVDVVFSVGGTVTGLVGQGLTLELHGGDDSQSLEIGGNGDFAFATMTDPSGSHRYVVLVEQQPHSPAQRCTVRYESFLARDVSDIDVVCGEFAYVTSSVSNAISAFSVDAATGALASAGPPIPTGASPRAMAGTTYDRDRKYLYAVNGDSNDISVFEVDYATGNLTAIPGSPFAAGSNPRAVTFHSVYVDGYDPPPQRVRSYLYVADAGSDEISAYQVSRGAGDLTPLSPASYATGTSPSVMAVDPSGRFLFVVNSGSNDISAFEMEGLTGALKPLPGSPFVAGSNVRSLAFSAGGQFLYAVNANGSTATISGFNIDPTRGALTGLTGFPHDIPSCSAVVTDQTGAYLYAAAGTSVLGYSIDSQTGALRPLDGFPVDAGANASFLTVDQTNQFLYLGNGSAGTVTGFALDAATGELTPMPDSPFTTDTSPDFIATF